MKDDPTRLQIRSKVSAITEDRVWQLRTPVPDDAPVLHWLQPAQNSWYSYYNWEDAMLRASQYIRLERIRRANRQNLNLYRGGGH